MNTPTQPGAEERASHTPAEVEALLLRCMRGMLTAVALNKPRNADWWRGAVTALRDLQLGAGQRMAAKDQLLPPDEPDAGFQAARAALAVGAERAHVAQVHQLLAAHGIEIATHAVSDADFLAVEQFPGGVVAAIDEQDEHAPAGVVSDDGAGAHAPTVSAPAAGSAA